MSITFTTKTNSELKSHWESVVADLESQLSEAYGPNMDGKPDIELRHLTSLMKASVEDCEQWRSLDPGEDYLECTRMIQVRIQLPKELIEKLFKVKTYSLYGVGLYIPMEGVLISSNIRTQSNWDKSQTGARGVWFNLNDLMPDWFSQNYRQRLAIAAHNGLFVPKNCRLIVDGWIDSRRQLNFFDLAL